MMNSYDEQIRRRAHEIWEREGRLHGRDAEHWQRACQEIEGEASVRRPKVARKASLPISPTDPAENVTSPLSKRKAVVSSRADGETSSTTSKARGTPTKAASERKRSEALSESGGKRSGNMPSELGGRRGEHSEASPVAKYRHPENPDLTWSGRGRRPAWIREGVEAGRALSDFEIGA